MKINNFDFSSESDSDINQGVKEEKRKKRVQISKSTLKRAHRYLKIWDRKKKKRIRMFNIRNRNEYQQVKIKSNRSILIHEIKKFVLKHDWNSVIKLLKLLIEEPSGNYLTSYIFKVCFVLLFSHPSSNFTLAKEFLKCVELSSTADVNKFLKILISIPEEHHYKLLSYSTRILDDPAFDCLTDSY